MMQAEYFLAWRGKPEYMLLVNKKNQPCSFQQITYKLMEGWPHTSSWKVGHVQAHGRLLNEEKKMHNRNKCRLEKSWLWWCNPLRDRIVEKESNKQYTLLL